MAQQRRFLVGVMGGGDAASPEAVALAEELGQEISLRGWALLSGGRPLILLATPEPWPGFFRSLSPAVHSAVDVAGCCRLIEALERGQTHPA